MRGSLRRKFREISIYQGYVHGIVVLSLVITVLIIVPIHSFILLNASASIRVRPTAMGGLDMFFLNFTSFFLSLTLIFAVATYSEELLSGGVTLALSHPISRTSYVLSWMLASLVTTTLIYFLSILIPLLIINPSLVEALKFREIFLKILEIFELGSLLFLISSIFRGRGKAIIVGLILYYFLPMISLFAISITLVPPHQRATPLLRVMLAFYPSYRTMLPINSSPWPATVLIALASWGLTLLYAKYRMEVRS